MKNVSNIVSIVVSDVKKAFENVWIIVLIDLYLDI